MDKQKTLIFFGAHPDDETFGMGATLAQYAATGVKVYYVCSTRGEAGTVDLEYMQDYKTIADLRTAEMQCAASVLSRLPAETVLLQRHGGRRSQRPLFIDGQGADAAGADIYSDKQ